MNCEKATKLIPDLKLERLSERQREKLQQHLSECYDCTQWAKTWEHMRELGAQVCFPPSDFDWSAFNQAIEIELLKNPVSGQLLQTSVHVRDHSRVNFESNFWGKLMELIKVGTASILGAFSRGLGRQKSPKARLARTESATEIAGLTDFELDGDKNLTSGFDEKAATL